MNQLIKPADILEGAKRFALMSEEDRLKHLGGFLADTSQFQNAKRAMKRLYRGWRTAKEGHLLIISGPSGSGKTTVADDVLADIGQDWQGVVSDGTVDVVDPVGPLPPVVGITKQGPTGLVRPVVKVFVEPKARTRGLLRDTLRALGVRAPIQANFGELMEQLVEHVDKQHVRQIIFDEIHHVVEGHGQSTAYEAVEVIKMLLLQARVQIVCVGLEIAHTIPDSYDELPRHVRGRLKLRPLSDDVGNVKSDYMGFIKALANDLPFDEHSPLWKPDLALRIHLATGGFMGHIVNLVQAACERAIEDGEPGITQKMLGDVYADIEDVEDKENPFRSERLDPVDFDFIRKGVAERRRKAIEAKRKAEITAAKRARIAFTKR